MAYKVYETDAAIEDISQIVEYIAERLNNRQAAANWLSDYEAVLDRLEEYPRMFEFSRILGHRQMGYRKFVVGKYLALYTIKEDAKEVWIQRVFYGPQDYQKYL